MILHWLRSSNFEFHEASRNHGIGLFVPRAREFVGDLDRTIIDSFFRFDSMAKHV